MTGFISIADFGAKGDGKTDSRAAIQKAFDHAKANDLDVFIPEGTFIHSGTLTATGIRIFGAGDDSILKSSVYGQEALILKGTGVELSDLHLTGVGGSRAKTDQSQKVLVQDAQDFTIERVHIEGTSAGGIKINTGVRGYIADNLIENTLADSIHMTHASHDMLVERNTIRYSGDDGIAVVSYGGAAGKPNHDITIRDNDVRYNTWGRGISVLGGNDVLIEHNNVAGGTNDRAGIYIAAESQYNTQSVHNVSVTGNTITDAGGKSTGHGAITLYNSQNGSFIVDGVTVAGNDIIDPRKHGIAVIGSGTQKLAIYDNHLTGGSFGLLANADPKAHISTTRPSGEKNVFGTEGADQFAGTANGDAIYGRGGNDTLRGEAGDDLLVGGAGNDGLTGGAGHDRLDGSEGNDALDGGAGNDWLVGGAGADTLVFARGYGQDRIGSFQSGVDKIDLRALGFASLDQLKQGATIASGQEANGITFVTLDFGNGDILRIDGIGSLAAGDFMFAAGGGPTDPPPTPDPAPVPVPVPKEITGTDGNDTLAGTDGADTMWGVGGDDIVRGGKGNDSVSGGTGTDIYVGERGGGMDTIRWFEAGEKIDVTQFGWTSFAEMQAAGMTMTSGKETSGASFVTVDFGGGDGFKAVGANSLAAEHFLFAPSAPDPDPAPVPKEITGTDGNDMLAGTDGADTMWGVGGDDIVRGGKGNDSVSGGTGTDIYVGERGGGMDTIRWFEAGEKIDVTQFGWTSFAEMQAAGMTMTSGKETSGASFVTVDFGGGDGFKAVGANSLAAEHFLFAPSGPEPVNGTSGNDKLTGSDNADDVNGMNGHDTLYGLAGDDTLRGGSGYDHLYGGAGNDRLEGGDGHDKLLGEAGEDVLVGGTGNDWMDGGTGADTFVVAPGGGFDSIYRFETGSDKLDFSAFGFEDMADLEDSADVTRSLDGRSLWIDFGGGDHVSVFGLDVDKISAQNVIF